ncbi:hypothetical protein HNP65_001471 [Thermosipho japonicus]|uniref:Uncharacterized protein n=1 Tax=Thermosipho japonicus TaxID=90323 RepID=A0A841GT99_9BACT|nr:hypothetical protein [Thermosipho japonicus]MBB6063008.1 hypothetical protein [Thermosipho japonicus]
MPIYRVNDVTNDERMSDYLELTEKDDIKGISFGVLPQKETLFPSIEDIVYDSPDEIIESLEEADFSDCESDAGDCVMNFLESLSDDDYVRFLRNFIINFNEVYSEIVYFNYDEVLSDEDIKDFLLENIDKIVEECHYKDFDEEDDESYLFEQLDDDEMLETIEELSGDIESIKFESLDALFWGNEEKLSKETKEVLEKLDSERYEINRDLVVVYTNYFMENFAEKVGEILVEIFEDGDWSEEIWTRNAVNKMFNLAFDKIWQHMNEIESYIAENLSNDYLYALSRAFVATLEEF